MGVFDKFSGINVASGFKLQAKAPLDPRAVVDTIADRDALITENGAYEGMQVYVKEDKKTYCLKSLDGKKVLKVGDTLPEKIYYDTSITPTLTEDSPPLLVAGSYTIIANSFRSVSAIAAFNDVVDFIPGENPFCIYANSDTLGVEEINNELAGDGLSITEKGWQGTGAVDTSSAAGVAIAQYNDPQGIFYVSGVEWEEVGAGGGSSVTLPNNIVSETIVLTAEQVNAIHGTTLTNEQFAQLERANTAFFDLSAGGSNFVNFVKTPFIKVDISSFGNTDTPFVFTTSTYQPSYDIGGMCLVMAISKNTDGTHTLRFIYAAVGVPTPPDTGGEFVLTSIDGGSLKWNKRFNIAAVTLFKNNWDSNLQQKVSADCRTDSVVIVSPEGNSKDYVEAGIYCSAQNDWSLTFTCETIPTVNIYVNIFITGGQLS